MDGAHPTNIKLTSFFKYSFVREMSDLVAAGSMELTLEKSKISQLT